MRESQKTIVRTGLIIAKVLKKRCRKYKSEVFTCNDTDDKKVIENLKKQISERLESSKDIKFNESCYLFDSEKQIFKEGHEIITTPLIPWASHNNEYNCVRLETKELLEV